MSHDLNFWAPVAFSHRNKMMCDSHRLVNRSKHWEPQGYDDRESLHGEVSAQKDAIWSFQEDTEIIFYHSVERNELRFLKFELFLV